MSTFPNDAPNIGRLPHPDAAAGDGGRPRRARSYTLILLALPDQQRRHIAPRVVRGVLLNSGSRVYHCRRDRERIASRFDKAGAAGNSGPQPQRASGQPANGRGRIASHCGDFAATRQSGHTGF